MQTNVVTLAFLAFLGGSSVAAQTFSSGSTGADGALDLSAGNRTVQLPESGVLNYTTVSVPAGRTLTFGANRRNTPVILLAQGAIDIAGSVNVFGGGGNGIGNPGGHGGFPGGAAGQPGLGPGGGRPEPGDTHGRWVGPSSLVPIVGGSGGSGKFFSGTPSPGGGGGGAIVIASSTSVSVTGDINASGASMAGANEGSGSGGAIRIVANAVFVSGTLRAQPGNSGGYPGIIRLEAALDALQLTRSTFPPAILAAVNPVIVPTQAPSLTIVSVGGFSVPAYAGTRRDTVDVTLPRTMPEPIDLVVRGHQVPPGTSVGVTFSGSPSATHVPATLQGTIESSTAVVRLSGLTHTESVTFVFVFAVFDLPLTPDAVNPPGPNHVAKLRLESVIGGAPRTVFLRDDGSPIERNRINPELVRRFGQ